jgi:type IV pilus assembly protein PilC/MSHA biogenesis protein MshG
MAVFEYAAVDHAGKTVRGHMVGESLDLVARRLADSGLTVTQLGLAPSMADPLEVPVERSGLNEAPRTVAPGVAFGSTIDAPPTEQRHRFETDVIGPLVGGVSLSKLQFFFRQFGTMANAGIELRHALDTLGNQSQGKLRAVLHETRDHVAAGRPMSVGLQRYPEVFSPLMMSLVRAGEEGGMLGDMCLRLADYIQRDIELRNMIRRETFYPKLVFGASVCIFLGANLVINWLAPGAKGLNSPLALWIFVAIMALGVLIFRKFLLRQPGVKFAWDQFVISVPYVGPMNHGFAMSKFGRAFGALYDAGLPLARCLQLGADSCGNEALRSRIYPVSHRLDEGAGIAQTFAQAGVFSPIVMDMVNTGEMTGNMHEMLMKASEYYEDEGQTRARQAASIYGVAMLLLVGVYVAYLVISFYMGFAADRVADI